MRWICQLGSSPGGARAVALHGHRLVMLVPPGSSVPGAAAAYADRVVYTDITDHEATLTVVDALAAEHGEPRLVVSFTELAQEVCARIATARGLPSVSPEAAARARDKAEMRRLLAGTRYAWRYASGSAPEVFAAISAEPEGTRWVVKPVDGLGSRGVTGLASYAELERWLETAGEGRFIAEHAAQGPEYSVEAVSAAGRHTVLAITEKQSTGSPRFVETGHTVPAPLAEPDAARLRDAAMCVLDTLGIRDGASHTELRLDPAHGPVVIETHTRVAGDCIPELVELATGQDQYERAIAALLGTDPALTGPPAAGAAAIGFVVPPASGVLRGVVVPPVGSLLRWEFDKHPGSELTDVRSADDRIGYAIVLGSTAAEASEAAAKAVAGVRVSVDAGAAGADGRRVPVSVRRGERGRADHVIIVETLTSGTGLGLVEAATRRAERVTFVTRDTGRYANDRSRDLLTSGAVRLRVGETRSAGILTEILAAESAGSGRATLIVPNEQFLLPAAVAAEKAGIPFFPVPAARLAQDKHAFRQTCATRGIPAPSSTAAESVDAAVAAAEAAGYPVVLKPSVGTGSYGVVSVSDRSELCARFPEVLAEATGQGGVPLVEEFLVGPVVSAEVLYSDGVPHVLGICDRIMSGLPYFMELAMRFPVALAAGTHREIEEVCAALSDLLSYPQGPAHIEFVLTADGPRVVEFNPRFGGRTISAMVGAALDWDFYDGVIASYLGESVRVPPAVAAAAEQSLYARHGGRFEGVAGRDLAERVPGLRDIRVIARPGDVLVDAKDQRSEYGRLWCTGATADEAGIRAAAAAAYLRPVFADHD